MQVESKKELLKAGIVQFSPTRGMVDDNLEALSNLIIMSSQQGAQLVVLPELCWTGYLWFDPEHIRPFCEPAQSGPGQDFLRALSQKMNIAICFGFPEAGGSRLYNSQALITPDGTYFGPYRKVHLFQADTFWASPGDLGFQIWRTAWGRLGTGICMDLNYSDWTQFHIENKTDAILFSTNWLDEGYSIISYWQQQLNGYSGYFLAANRGGEEFGVRYRGESAIFHDGQVIVKTHSKQDAILIADINLGDAIP